MHEINSIHISWLSYSGVDDKVEVKRKTGEFVIVPFGLYGKKSGGELGSPKMLRVGLTLALIPDVR